MAKGLRLRLKEEELRRLYQIEKKSLEDIARLYGASRVAVWKYCGSLGLTRRSRSEARLEAQKRGKVPQNYYEINDNFFSKWSPDMAYIFGLLMADGCLSRVKNGSYRISLCLNDKDLLESVAKAMNSNHAIALSRHQKGLHLFIIGRQKISQDLMKLGMKVRKSLDLEFPNMPRQYLSAFIRGVFDGDGCVYYRKGATAVLLNTNFVSGSKNFIYGIEKALRELGMPKKKIYEHRHDNATYYTLKYAHSNSIILFAYSGLL
ncbi:MAG: LAGLIDADG family homing endonuclease [Candidatus Omnitrophota bacterium]